MGNCDKAGFAPKISVTSSDLDFLISLVSFNLGVFIMGETVWKSVDTADIHVLDLEDAETDWNLVLVSKRNRIMNNASIAFADFAVEYYANKTWF